MTEWHSKWAFFLILFVLIAIGYRYYRRKHLNASLQFSYIDHIHKKDRGLRAQLSELPNILKGVALVLCIFALARPQEPNTTIKRNIEGIDIMITLDISDSMLIEDMLPENRLVSSKKTIADFISRRVSDRIGLIVFSGESYTRVPLTIDYPLLLNNLAAVQTSRNIKMGTAIGVALANAVARMKDSTAKERVIIFLTDGENNSGTIDPETALDIAKGYKLRIYSIGMGKDGDAKLPIYQPDGMGNMIKTYRPIHSTINEELLTKFATETGGKFWRANTTNALENVFKEIDQLEKTKFAVDKFTKYSELFQPYLKWALFMYILSAFLGRTVLRRVP